MNIIVKLSSAEVKAIKQYHNDIFDEQLTSNDIALYINSIVSGILHSPRESISSYVNKFESNL
jgi:hypothetical protein